jgi:hypothetical protein
VAILADAVLVVHLGFIAFVALGGFLALRWPRLAWFHIPSAAWGAAIELGNWICPLTPLENWLRLRGGGTAYSRSFVEQYIIPIVYPEGLTREMQLVLGFSLLAVNGAVYAFVLYRAAQGTRGAQA